MSLQGPALASRMRRTLSSGSPLRCPCILFSAVLAVTPASAKCHIFSVWHYPKPQRCFTALAAFHAKHAFVGQTTEREEPNQERIEIPLPKLDDITWGEPGPDELRAIALLRALYDSR